MFNPLSAAAKILTPITDIIKKAVPDKDLQNTLINNIRQMALKGEFDVQLAQIGVNLQQAKSKFWWVAGARPGAMWICNAGLLYHFVIAPPLGLARVDITELMVIAGSLLGVGGYRSVEKIRNAENNR